MKKLSVIALSALVVFMIGTSVLASYPQRPASSSVQKTYTYYPEAQTAKQNLEKFQSELNEVFTPEVIQQLKEIRSAEVDYLASLNAAIKKNPNDDELYYERAQCRMSLSAFIPSKDPESNSLLHGAIEDYSKMIMLNSSADKAYYGRAKARIKLNDYKSALKDLNTAIAINPKTEYYWLRTRAHLGLNNKEAALKDWEKVMASDKMKKIKEPRKNLK